MENTTTLTTKPDLSTGLLRNMLEYSQNQSAGLRAKHPPQTPKSLEKYLELFRDLKSLLKSLVYEPDYSPQRDNHLLQGTLENFFLNSFDSLCARLQHRQGKKFDSEFSREFDRTYYFRAIRELEKSAENYVGRFMSQNPDKVSRYLLMLLSAENLILEYFREERLVNGLPINREISQCPNGTDALIIPMFGVEDLCIDLTDSSEVRIGRDDHRGIEAIASTDPSDSTILNVSFGKYHQWVSCKHAILTRTNQGGSGWSIQDMNSTNGTYIDTNQISPDAQRGAIELDYQSDIYLGFGTKVFLDRRTLARQSSH